MKIDVLSIPDEGKEIDYQEDPLALQLSPELELKGEVRIRGFLYKTGKTIIVKGIIEAEPHLECGRCSSFFFLPLSFEFDQLFVPKSPQRPVFHKTRDEKKGNRHPKTGKSELSEPESGDEEGIDPFNENWYEGSSLSLDEMIREQVLLALPMRPLCTPECKGLCPVCKKNLNLTICDCPKEVEEKFNMMKNLFNQKMKGDKGE
ncbi:MAG: DUF177 domain-containing protein [Nitrospirae bacterium]|nr:DUF177 domain-containing protein [Nitrospirota bacterium]MBI3595435.1 DUF177 domain-containing protein [Nitrospirota bacterium]